MGDIEASFQQSLQTFRDGTSSTGSSLLKFASQVQQGVRRLVIVLVGFPILNERVLA